MRPAAFRDPAALTATLLVAVACLSACSSAMPVQPGQSYQYVCTITAYQYKNSGVDPQVTITNTGSNPLAVSQISIAIIGTGNTQGQVASTDLAPHDTGTAYIAPGASMRFNWVPGNYALPDSDAPDGCTVESIR